MKLLILFCAIKEKYHSAMRNGEGASHIRIGKKKF